MTCHKLRIFLKGIRKMLIRKSEINDLPKLTDIYNYEVLNGTATFDIHTKTIQERSEWFYAHNVGNHPLIVAESDGEVIGYASLSAYNEKEAYAQTVELSVYIDSSYRKNGVATALMSEIIKIAKADPVTKKIVSLITSGNEASCRLHTKFGFTFCGSISNLGKKFGKDLGVDFYCLDV